MRLLKYSFFFLFAISFIACGDDDVSDDDMMDTPPVYSIGIMSPSTDDKKVNDEIHIHVNFDEASDGTVHHAKVKIYQVDNEDNVIYEGPNEAHVHEMSGHYELHADVKLDSLTGVQAHTDWILEAKVWGHEAGAAEKMETIQFHVHPE